VYKEKKMKCAICISGFPRIMHYTYPYLKKYILDELDCDIFFAGYDDEQNNLLEKDIVDLYNPERWLVRRWNDEVKEEVWDAYGSRKINKIQKPTNPEAVISQRYNIFKCNELKKQHETENDFIYDAVFRIRTDYYFYTTPLPLPPPEDQVCIPSNGWDHGGYTDGFGYGTSQIMDVYSDCIFYMDEYHRKNGVIFHPEKLLKYHMQKSGIDRLVVGPNFCWRLAHFTRSLKQKLIEGIESDPEDFRNKYK